jgi:CheY-like chemotaxis protein
VRVLIVDYYPDAAELTCALLRLLSHDCRAALSGEEALRHVEWFDPDVAILDLRLPGLDGYELARQLRSKLGGHVFLVACAGWKYDLAKARAAGFDHHAIKPATLRELSTLMDLAQHRLVRRDDLRLS